MNALSLIVFDVNETLLDLTTLEPTFERIFGDKGAMRLWFANLIMYSSALTVAGCYVPFTDIGSAVMKMLADTRGIRIEDAEKKELVEKILDDASPSGGAGCSSEAPRGRIPAIHVD
jgi:2-haloacid dehalogenase